MTIAGTDVFARAFAVVVGEEGGYTNDPRDPGNWTGGAVGRGACNGTNWGIAASAHPTLDLRTLSLEQARRIYRDAYWAPIGGDQLPPALALLVFDAAVNNGVGHAIRWLQQSLGVLPDGQLGPASAAALAAHAGKGGAVCAEFLAQRTDYMARLPGWPVFGLGWARRLCALPFHAMQISAVPATQMEA